MRENRRGSPSTCCRLRVRRCCEHLLTRPRPANLSPWDRRDKQVSVNRDERRETSEREPFLVHAFLSILFSSRAPSAFDLRATIVSSLDRTRGDDRPTILGTVDRCLSVYRSVCRDNYYTYARKLTYIVILARTERKTTRLSKSSTTNKLFFFFLTILF